MTEQEKYQDRIMWGQAANLATEVITHIPDEDLEFPERFNEWRLYFYNELIKLSPRQEENVELCESCGGTGTKESPLINGSHEKCKLSEHYKTIKT